MKDYHWANLANLSQDITQPDWKRKNSRKKQTDAADDDEEIEYKWMEVPSPTSK